MTHADFEQRLGEILETLCAEAFIFGNFCVGKGVSVRLPDDNHELPPVEKATQSIITIFEDYTKVIVGKEETPEIPVNDYHWRIRNELRQTINKASKTILRGVDE